VFGKAWGGLAMVRTFLALLFFWAFVTNAVAQRALQPGDSLDITVWQDPKLDRKIIVGPDGMISFPLAGHIRAGGRTTRAIEDILRSRLKKNYTGQLDITVGLAGIDKEAQEEAKPRIFITGEVLKPGPYKLTPNINVVQALALAGGVGPFAAPQRIQVHRKIRGVDSIFLFNFNAYKSGTDTLDNINLRPGDIIIVPERGLLE
jgi:polysaccharide export outer membrane protein